MALLLLILLPFILFGALFTFVATTLLESLVIYSPLVIVWIAFNTAFFIQIVIAIVSKIKKKKFGKANIIRSIIFGIIAFILFVVLIVLIFLFNFQSWKEFYLNLG